MLRKLIDDHRFAFADLVLVLISGAIGIVKPELAFWFLPIALLPWVFRAFAGTFPFRRTLFDLPMLIFLMTATAGCIVAYNKVAATEKFFFIILSILSYYALCGQPKRNFAPATAVFLVVGVCICLYYFLTSNFESTLTEIAVINSVAIWLMQVRPEVAWSPIPAGYVPGLAIITTTFVSYWLMNSKETLGGLLKLTVITCFAIVLLAILASKSTSVWVALLGGAGVWVLWRLFTKNWQKKYHWFPWLVLLYLVSVMVFICVFDPVASASPNGFGTNSRPEVFTRALYFVRDFPISGAGLATFPGLYSEYMLGIPYFYFTNSYDTLLDVVIEQGLLGGLAFLFIYLTSIFQMARKVYKQETRTQCWLALFVLIFTLLHGLMQDYLYNAAGTILLFFPVAMAMMLGGESTPVRQAVFSARISGTIAKRKIPVAAMMTVFVCVGALLTINKLESVWYSNLGAVQLAQAQLASFPESGWLGTGVIPKLHDAETSLQTALRLDPENLTANHRLGLIYTLYRDFESASKYLEAAYKAAPNHRGIKKSLGYSYLWMGDVDTAQRILVEIPETSGELDAYYWWWNNQDRADLSNSAYLLQKNLNSAQSQP